MKSHTWHVNKQAGFFYARATSLILMHRFIMEVDEWWLVDHKNRNTLDNRRSNLRKVNRTENQANSVRGRKFNKWKGVNREMRTKTPKYRAQLQKNGIRYIEGPFDTEIEAARAYNDLALKHFGEFALLNVFDQDKTLEKENGRKTINRTSRTYKVESKI